MQKTKISYLSHSWNPISMRCTPMSAGCQNCWHLAMAKRLAKNPLIPKAEREAYAGGPPVLREKELKTPLHLKKPARIGVQFMGDLFYEKINPEWVREIYHVMHNAPQHSFFILTKRAKRMASWYNWIGRNWTPWPLPNLHLGVSIEDQKTADERISILFKIPAAHRWVSIEPCLNEVNIEPYLRCRGCGYSSKDKALHGDHRLCTDPTGVLDFIVLGGETGPGARPLHPDWVRSIKEQCVAANIPFYFKNWGDCPYPHNSDISDWIIVGYDPYIRKDNCFLDGKNWKEIPK